MLVNKRTKMENLSLGQFVELYKNSLVVLNFESDLRKAQSSMNSRFETAASKNRSLTEADRATVVTSIGNGKIKDDDRNIYILANVLFGASYSTMAKEFEISTSRAQQIVHSELARFKHPIFQRVISSPKIIDRYIKVISTQLLHYPNNELAKKMMLRINRAKQLEADMISLRNSYAAKI